jgi:hypothetical protein
MGIRTLCAAAVVVLVAAGPAAGVAHAQPDLDCRDFAFQEDGGGPGCRLAGCGDRSGGTAASPFFLGLGTTDVDQ